MNRFVDDYVVDCEYEEYVELISSFGVCLTLDKGTWESLGSPSSLQITIQAE